MANFCCGCDEPTPNDDHGQDGKNDHGRRYAGPITTPATLDNQRTAQSSESFRRVIQKALSLHAGKSRSKDDASVREVVESEIVLQ